MQLKKLFAILFCSVLPHFIFGQENLIFMNDQYSGINSAVIAPTQPFISPNPWDANIFSEDIFFNTDYAYISQQSYLGLLTGAKIQSRNIKKNRTGENTPSVLDFYNKDLGNYNFSSDILGPSFSIKTSIKEHPFTFGLFTRLRTQSSAVDVDNYLKFANQDILEPESYLLQPLEINVMNWGEVGFNVSTQIFNNSNYQWIVGANLKYEMGFDAVNVKSLSEMELSRTNEDIDGVDTKTIIASNYNIEANFATSYNFETEKYEVKQRGKGFGLDFGIAMVDRDEDADDYNLKWSVNVLDVGKVNYTGETHVFQGNPVTLINNPNLENTQFESPQQYFQLLSEEAYGNPNASLRGTDFQVGLPTSVHFNFSKNIGKNQYINADWIQRTPVFENSLKRTNILQTSFSVQKPVVGYGASMSLLEYQSLQFGGYVRLGPLILGSTNALPFIFKQKKLHSGDFYIAIKLYPFWDSEMKRHRRAKCNCD